jgi:hypothetical protein
MHLDLSALRASLGPLLPPAGAPEGAAFYYLAADGPGAPYSTTLAPAAADSGRAMSDVHRYALLSRMPRTAGGEIDPRALAALAGELARSTGLHDSVLALLPQHVWAGGDGLVDEARACSICMAPYAVGDTCRTLPCCHYFHSVRPRR